ncbi:hypothetical protein [Pseudomonas sp. SJZ080]|uniref:hypothetical protein n=1 Tax=Pseudomonas sp. SJZ080 TaxID=2572888 RepID=UPI0015B5D1A2|nr:hypothetical protein [Pseudomonas sp. SJZ080]
MKRFDESPVAFAVITCQVSGAGKIGIFFVRDVRAEIIAMLCSLPILMICAISG